MFFEGKAEFRQPHAFRNLEEVYPDGQPLPRIDDSDRIEFFESQRFRTGAKGKKQKKKTPEVDAATGPETAEEKAFEELGRTIFVDALTDGSLDAELEDLDLVNQIKLVTQKLKDSRTVDPALAPARPVEDVDLEDNVARLEALEDNLAKLDADLEVAIGDIDQYEKLIEFIKEKSEPEVRGIIDDLIERFNRERTADVNAIPEGGIDAEPAEDADVEVVGVSKKEAKKQVKVKVESEEVIEPEPESDVDSVDDDTEETQVLDAALKTLPKIK